MRSCMVADGRTDIVLHNVRIKVEAFDALDLTFDIREGTIGRLAVQASAGICSGSPLVHSHSMPNVKLQPVRRGMPGTTRIRQAQRG